MCDHLQFIAKLLNARTQQLYFNTSTMRIYLKFLETVTIMCEPYDSVLSILEEYEEKTGMAYRDMQFIHGDKDLSEHFKETLGQMNIQDGSIIHVGGNSKSGGYPSINFNGMEKSIIKQFSKTAPKWRIVDKGLNLEGRCDNPTCKAHNKKVWIQKGFGKFSMNKEVYDSYCPICSQLCIQVNNMGLYMAVCQGTGLIEGEKKKRNMFREHKQKTGMLTFEDKEETIVAWKYLEFQVSQLKNL